MRERFSRARNRLVARILGYSPRFSDRWAKAFGARIESGPVPWAELRARVRHCRLALVTTAGLHLEHQPPFDMSDPAGDPTFRVIPDGVDPHSIRITHDYYDHRDADRDVNVVFPIERLHELVSAGEVGSSAARHFSFMGHVLSPHIPRLVGETAPEVAERLKSDRVECVLLTPA